MQSIAIGIDFGTTKTLVAYSLSHGNKPEIAHLGRERNSVPTTAFVGEGGTWEFGDDADDYACDGALAERYADCFKLRLGSSFPVLQILDDKGLTSYSAREIGVQFFTYLRKRIEEELKASISGVVITHPVNFSPAQVEDLRYAVEQAGFSGINLLREPEAAGLAFCRLCPKEAFSGTALVVDWGGGTLDLALVSRRGMQIKVHEQYVAGNNTIGGTVFDDLLFKHISAKLQQKYGFDLTQDSLAIQRVQKKEIRKQKEKLSLPGKISVYLSLPSSNQNGGYPRMTLTKEELEEVITPQVTEGIKLIENLLARIKEGSLKPTQVLLIGGSTRIPLIGRLISEKTGLTCHHWQHSHEAVALGAALKNAPVPSYPIELSLTDAERFQGCIKKYNLNGSTISLTIPPKSAIGAQIHCGVEDTGLWGEVIVNIRKAPIVKLTLSDEGFRTGGKRYISLEGRTREVILPPGCSPHTQRICDCENYGSVIVELLPQNSASNETKRSASKASNSAYSNPISYTRQDSATYNKGNRHQSSTNNTSSNNRYKGKSDDSGCIVWAVIAIGGWIALNVATDGAAAAVVGVGIAIIYFVVILLKAAGK